jgi:regulator of protease activity HflC (stomatin/prohibitin superfamily)
MMTGTIVIIVFAVIVAIFVARALRMVPQQHGWVVERLGRYSRTLGPGLNLLFPIIDRVAYKFDMREHPINVSQQVCITKDNSQIAIDGIVYLQITDAQAAAYGTTNPLKSVEQLAQTVMRSDVGSRDLDEVLASRSDLNASIVNELDQAATNWGVKVLRYEIRDISPPEEVVRAMELQLTAERKKRAMIAQSKGEKEQAINVSEGERQQQINRAQGDKEARIQRATGEAQAITTVAEATAGALQRIGQSLANEGAREAMQMQVAKDFIEKWGAIAKESTVMLVPADTGDISRMVASAMKIVGTQNG